MGASRRVGAEGRAPDLPVFLNRFVGRARDVERVAELLDLHRIVTLIAPGGVGKTRLAVRVAEQTAARWKGGVWFADYSGATDPASVATALCSLFGVDRQPGQALIERLAERLQQSRCLLVLDGCEQLHAAIRDIAIVLLQRSPRLHVLATSRERLDIPGEALFPVLPLGCPAGGHRGSLDALKRCEAIELFEERAAANRPGFEINAGNADVVARLCQQLDGIPLALELAAARLRMMSLKDVESHLADRFRLLTGGSTKRHESVRTTIDWSYQFLDEAERLMFRRLSVFPSGFRLDAAAAILDDEGMGLVDALGRLVDKSLLTARTDFDGRTRYHMLETIRHYGMELVQQSGELDAAMGMSMEHHLGLAEEAAAMAESSDWQAWLYRLEAEHDNLLAVLAWACDRQHQRLPALVTSLGWYWQRRGDPSEGRQWLEVARGMATDDRSLLTILRWATSLAAHENDIASATRYAERALELADRSGDRIQSADARLALGNLVFYQQLPDWERQATVHYEAAMGLYDEAGLAYRYIAVVLNLSHLALASGDVGSGRARAALAEERARAGGWPHWQWRARMRLGIAAFLDGDDDEAEGHLTDCVRYDALNPEFGSRLQVVLRWLSAVAARRGDLVRSARMAGGASQVELRNPVETFVPHALATVLQEWQDRVRDALGDAAYGQHVEAGRRLSLHEVRRLALRSEQDAGDRLASLSRRELQIVELVSEGLTNREVSARLHLSPRTVDAHLDHVRNKLGLRSRTQMVRWLMESRKGGGQPEHDGLLHDLDPLLSGPPGEAESS
jgi:non-specific serine/threonine protein kinase